MPETAERSYEALEAENAQLREKVQQMETRVAKLEDQCRKLADLNTKTSNWWQRFHRDY